MYDLRMKYMHGGVGELFRSVSVNGTSRKVTYGLPAVVCTVICQHGMSVICKLY